MILPYVKPIFKAWPEDCFLSSVICVQENAKNWIWDNYIQISAYKGAVHEEKYRINFWPTSKHHHLVNFFDYCPFLVKNAVEYDFVEKKKVRMIDFIRDSIDFGYYVSLTVDEFFRKEREGAEGFKHPIYIYGYDDEKRCLYVGDCFDDWKYMIKELDYDIFTRAYDIVKEQSNIIGERRVYMYRLVQAEYNCDKTRIKRTLEAYLASEDRTAYRDRYYNNKYYGLDCYRGLMDYLNGRKNKKIDLSSFAFIVDHKKLMEERVGFLFEGVESKSEEFRRIKNQSQIMLNMAMKYNLSGKLEILDEIINMLGQMVSSEKETIESLIESEM